MKRKVMLICGRENRSADALFHAQLMAYVKSFDLSVMENSSEMPIEARSPQLVHFLKYFGVFNILRTALHRLLTPLERYLGKVKIERRIWQLRPTLQQLDWDQVDLYILGRSAGALVASRLAMEFPVKAVIALGYPFIHPVFGMQSYRVKYLPRMRQAMYVFQGIRDAYGAPEKISSIPMASYVHIIPLNTDHSFVLDDASWEEFTSQLAVILS
ncbi:alpha/beta family hydrolase [Aquirufa regiilacus]|uniref:KANL3/Tex30 alpha/beta hydrolase-like domain-containing protein n=2 Tax=Aquirufa regiilacus TaxID=3024868 RepID=A0ABU3TSR0_9BACT|nr:hypothetical protein [Aquirufa sp. LEOWEIH-7C]